MRAECLDHKGMCRQYASSHELGQTIRKYILFFWASQAVQSTVEARLCVEPRGLITVIRQHIRVVSLALPASRHYPHRATASRRFSLARTRVQLFLALVTSIPCHLTLKFVTLNALLRMRIQKGREGKKEREKQRAGNGAGST